MQQVQLIPAPFTDGSLYAPVGARFVDVIEQYGGPCFVCVVDHSAQLVSHPICVTRQAVNSGLLGEYIGKFAFPDQQPTFYFRG